MYYDDMYYTNNIYMLYSCATYRLATSIAYITQLYICTCTRYSCCLQCVCQHSNNHDVCKSQHICIILYMSIIFQMLFDVRIRVCASCDVALLAIKCDDVVIPTELHSSQRAYVSTTTSRAHAVDVSRAHAVDACIVAMCDSQSSRCILSTTVPYSSTTSDHTVLLSGQQWCQCRSQTSMPRTPYPAASFPLPSLSGSARTRRRETQPQCAQVA